MILRGDPETEPGAQGKNFGAGTEYSPAGDTEVRENNMTTDDICSELFRLQDKKYRDFHKRLIPTVEEASIIGVRTPELRKLAKTLAKQGDARGFLDVLPHQYFDENQLHAFLIAEEKDFDRCIFETERFLPYIDNWATCDQLSPKIFKKHHEELVPYIEKWIASHDIYTVRFASGMLMEHFLDDDFQPGYPEMVANIRSEEYYINMMTAWYFATALAKQYDRILPFLEERRLEPWTHNKAIQKAVESRRIAPEQKAYLKMLKVPNARR